MLQPETKEVFPTPEEIIANYEYMPWKYGDEPRPTWVIYTNLTGQRQVCRFQHLNGSNSTSIILRYADGSTTAPSVNSCNFYSDKKRQPFDKRGPLTFNIGSSSPTTPQKSSTLTSFPTPDFTFGVTANSQIPSSPIVPKPVAPAPIQPSETPNPSKNENADTGKILKISAPSSDDEDNEEKKVLSKEEEELVFQEIEVLFQAFKIRKNPSVRTIIIDNLNKLN